MRRMRSLVVVLLFISSLLFAEQPETLIWGIIPNYAPYSYVTDEGKPSGFVVRVIERILQELNVSYRIHIENWDTMYPKVMSGEVHTYAPFVNIPSRAETIYWPKQSLVVSFTTVVTRKQGKILSMSDLAEKVFVVTKYDAPSKTAFEYLMQNMHMPYTLYEVSGTQEAIALLNEGTIDGYVVDNLFARLNPGLASGVIALNPRSGYWTCAIDAKPWVIDIVNRVSARLSELQSDPSSYYYEELEAYSPSFEATSEFPAWALILLSTSFAAAIISLLIVYLLTKRLRASAAKLRIAVQEKSDELTAAYDQLIQSGKMVTLGEAIAGIAHEVSTPLGVAYTAATLLNSTRNNAEEFYNVSSDAMPVIVENLHRAGELIQAFKQITIDQTSGEMSEIPLPEYIAQIWNGVAQKYVAFENIRFSVYIKNQRNENIRIRLQTYPGALSRVFLQLIDNAVKHGFDPMPEHPEISCTVVTAYIEDTLTLIFSIEDNGIGYPQEIQSKIMEPFFTTKLTDPNHSGLGLSTAYRILEKTWKLKSFKIENRSVGGVRVSFTIQPKTPEEQKITIIDKLVFDFPYPHRI